MCGIQKMISGSVNLEAQSVEYSLNVLVVPLEKVQL